LTPCDNNNDCVKAFESCGTFLYQDSDNAVKTAGKRCFPTKYCNKNAGNKDSLTWKKLYLAGKIMCDKKKEDVTAAKKPKVVIPKELKRL